MKTIELQAGRNLNLPDLHNTWYASRNKWNNLVSNFKAWCHANERLLLAVGAVCCAACVLVTAFSDNLFWQSAFAVVAFLSLAASDIDDNNETGRL